MILIKVVKTRSVTDLQADPGHTLQLSSRPRRAQTTASEHETCTDVPRAPVLASKNNSNKVPIHVDACVAHAQHGFS